jgi:hypothetical protein
MTQEKKLTPSEEDALREIGRMGLLKKAIPPKLEHRLIELGYIEHRIGGPVATAKGTASL